MDDHRLHVIFGSAPLGKAIARELRGRGADVRIVSRSGRSDVPRGVEQVACDASDTDAATDAAEGASVIYHAAQPPYGRWPALAPALTDGILAAAERTGATLAYGDNLYMYGPVTGPLHEDLPDAAAGPNGRTRARLARTVLRAHADGRVRAVIGRGSNFFGPEVLVSSVGEGVFGRILAGKAAQVLGDPDQLHSYTFVDDFARALVTLAEREEAYGRAWHVPTAAAVTTREFVRTVHQEAGHPGEPKLMVAPKLALSLLAPWNPTMRAVRESLYQSERPWVVDDRAYTTAFGGGATDPRDAIRATLGWYRARAGRPHATERPTVSAPRDGVPERAP